MLITRGYVFNFAEVYEVDWLANCEWTTFNFTSQVQAVDRIRLPLVNWCLMVQKSFNVPLNTTINDCHELVNRGFHWQRNCERRTLLSTDADCSVVMFHLEAEYLLLVVHRELYLPFNPQKLSKCYFSLRSLCIILQTTYENEQAHQLDGIIAI